MNDDKQKRKILITLFRIISALTNNLTAIRIVNDKNMEKHSYQEITVESISINHCWEYLRSILAQEKEKRREKTAHYFHVVNLIFPQVALFLQNTFSSLVRESQLGKHQIKEKGREISQTR